ncbi:DNA repair protein RAD51 homolog 4-like isoform X2 [Glycine soja]|uniref:DNA repair protein RAD51-like 4 isoform B n=1 Tax=Glycine soja TaxID=3848 RepID=A0A445I1I8_GLYSO|nr:DNA repair protein RAD51 homolog 4-like isoform X2 [Glycine soja]KHN21996.1 DNA repair protein RAD51 like 4 [Glycine soja]RZB79933.1 DNA repair protein RAD51-like 4 isoform B [Glycine soja]
MAPLESLEKEYPLIDSNFQSFCASHGIFSVEDFLLHDLDALLSFTDNHSTSQTLKQGIDQLISIIDALHPPLLNGLQLLEDAQRNKHVLSTGCEGIDALLRGGLREGQLTELVGSSSSGKTQACLLSASTVVAKHKSSVIYLDTGNSFSPQRIAHFVGQSSGHIFGNQADHMLKKVLDRIICYSVFDVYHMFDVLHQLKINLRSEIVKSNQHVRLLIVDSISSLITPILGGSGPQGHALMISAGFLLKKLAHEHNIAVLVTNHVVGGDDGISKPAMGESWKSVPHVRILLSRDCGSNVCDISILKHPSMASGRATSSTMYL